MHVSNLLHSFLQAALDSLNPCDHGLATLPPGLLYTSTSTATALYPSFLLLCLTSSSSQPRHSLPGCRFTVPDCAHNHTLLVTCPHLTVISCVLCHDLRGLDGCRCADLVTACSAVLCCAGAINCLLTHHAPPQHPTDPHAGSDTPLFRTPLCHAAICCSRHHLSWLLSAGSLYAAVNTATARSSATTSPANLQLACRLVANGFKHEAMREWVDALRSELFDR